MTNQPSRAALRQKRYRERIKARNANVEQSVTAQATVTENVTPPVTTKERNEYNEMVDDPGFVPPVMTPEEKQCSDAVLAEFASRHEKIDYRLRAGCGLLPKQISQIQSICGKWRTITLVTLE
jgi:hypothetical protein